MINIKKVVVNSPANIAFVKYWGRRDDRLILPLNSSVSMNMSGCTTTTSCEWVEEEKDEIKVKWAEKEWIMMEGVAREKVIKIVERVRQRLRLKLNVRIETENNFPEGTGIASSASGFSALTKALYESAGEKLSEQEMSVEARLSGSGSACRSIPNGFVVWEKGTRDDGTDSYAYSIAGTTHWKELRDIVCVVDTGNKKVSSGEGHVRAKNEYMQARLATIEQRVKQTVEAIIERDLEKLGIVSEVEAISLHTVCMMSEPPIFYWTGATLDLMARVREWREKGIMAYYTMDAGANVHLITVESYVAKIKELLKNEKAVKQIIVNNPDRGARVV